MLKDHFKFDTVLFHLFKGHYYLKIMVYGLISKSK